MSAALSPARTVHPMWVRVPHSVLGRQVIVARWTPEEDAVLLKLLDATHGICGKLRYGALRTAARGLERSYEATKQRLIELRRKQRRKMAKPDGAEGDDGTASAAAGLARVPRGAPSAAAPGSGRVHVSSQTAGAGVPSPAGTPPMVAPAGPSAAERNRARELEAHRRPRAEPVAIERKCSRCRGPFTAATRFLFRCKPCRGVDA